MAAPIWALLLLGVALLVPVALAADDTHKAPPSNGYKSPPPLPPKKSPPPPPPKSPPPPPPKKSPPPPPPKKSPPPPPPKKSPPPPPPKKSPPPPPPKKSPPSPYPVPSSSPPPPSLSSPPPPPTLLSPPPPVLSTPPPPVLSSPPPPVSSPPPPSPSPVPVPPPPSNLIFCKNTTQYPTCTTPALCPKRCSQSCHMDCATCKPICDCNLPGAVCQDPRFIGGDGNTFYFHGRKDRDFCLVSDANLHVNAHFIGNHVPTLKRDPTWVQAIAVLFAEHRLYVGARKTAEWDDEVDRLQITFDGEPMYVQGIADAKWQSPAVPSLSVTRTKAANGVVVELKGVFKITANAVPITEEDSRIHNYGLRPDDCLAHLDLAFKFYSLTSDVNGVLGQTYRPDYVNRLDVGAKMPIMGGERAFTSSGLFATDCAVARFGRDSDDSIDTIVSEPAEIKCSTGVDGIGVVCKK